MKPFWRHPLVEVASFVFIVALVAFTSLCAHAQVPIYTRPAGLASGGSISGAILAPDGTDCTAPSYAFSSTSGFGMTMNTGSGQLVLCSNIAGGKGVNLGALNNVVVLSNQITIGGDTSLVRDGANILANKNGTNAQEFRVYGTTTGPKYLTLSHNGTNAIVDTSASSGVLILANANASSVLLGSGSRSAALQLRTAQATSPTCSGSCGTSPTASGSDTGGFVTMGATGVPASPFTITFNGTWSAAPQCIVQSALSTMVVGKMPIAVQTTTTTITVTTNGTAPGNSDKYQYICMGQ